MIFNNSQNIARLFLWDGGRLTGTGKSLHLPAARGLSQMVFLLPDTEHSFGHCDPEACTFPWLACFANGDAGQ